MVFMMSVSVSGVQTSRKLINVSIDIQKKNLNTNFTNFSCLYSCNSLICVIRDYSF